MSLSWKFYLGFAVVVTILTDISVALWWTAILALIDWLITRYWE